MGCSHSSPAFTGSRRVAAEGRTKQMNHNSSTSTDVKTPPRTTSSEGSPDVCPSDQTETGPNPTPPRTLKIASSLPSSSIRVIGLPRNTFCHGVSAKTKSKPTNAVGTQGHDSVPSILVAEETVSPSGRVSFRAPRKWYLNQAFFKGINVDCLLSGTNGALSPRKATPAAPFESSSAGSPSLITGVQLSTESPAGLAAIAAAFGKEGRLCVRLQKCMHWRLMRHRNTDAARKSTDVPEMGPTHSGHSALDKQESDLKDSFVPDLKEDAVQAGPSLPTASSGTPTVAQEIQTETVVRDRLLASERPSLLKRIKRIQAKPTRQASYSSRLLQLLGFNCESGFPCLRAHVTKRTVTTAPEVEHVVANSYDPQRHQGAHPYEQKLPWNLLLFKSSWRPQKNNSDINTTSPRDGGNDAFRGRCYASVASAKAALIRRAAALRRNALIMNAAGMRAFRGLATILGRGCARKTRRSQQTGTTLCLRCRNAESLTNSEREDVCDCSQQAQTSASRQCCLVHKQESPFQTASASGGGSNRPMKQTAVSAAVNTAGLPGETFDDWHRTDGGLLADFCCGFEKKRETVSFQQHLPEPSAEEMRAVWCVMKIGAAKTRQLKAEWLRQLELLIVKLNPLDAHEPTRGALLEARLLDRCVEFLKDFPNCADICGSSLAILVYMSLNEETSEQLAANHGYEAVADLLKKYYNRCIELATGRVKRNNPNEGLVQRAEGCNRLPVSTECPSFSGATTRPDDDSAGTPLPSDAAASTATCTLGGHMDESASGECLQEDVTLRTDESHMDVANCILQPDSGRPHDGGGQQNCLSTAAEEQNRHTSEALARERRASFDADSDAGILNSEALLVELLTLIWRIIFASSLDGDEYAQIWVAAGAAEPALECLASDLPIFSSSSFVCWVFGALRFLPLDNASLCITFVQHRRLFEYIIKKMDTHCTEPMLMENGFAVLANYQRNHPTHTAVLCQIPQVWQKCVSWLRRSELFYAPDTVYQGLYAIGLACSYSPIACVGLKQAGGIDLATRLSAAYEIIPFPEFRLDSTPDAGPATRTSSGPYEEEHFGNEAEEKNAKTCSASDDTGVTPGRPVTPEASSVSDTKSTAPAHASQDRRHDHEAPESSRDCTTEKMKIIFQFAEGLIRLLESCPATTEPARRNLQEETIIEEDEEILDEEEAEEKEGGSDGVDLVENNANPLEMEKEPAKPMDTAEDRTDTQACSTTLVTGLHAVEALAMGKAAQKPASACALQREAETEYPQENGCAASYTHNENACPSHKRAEELNYDVQSTQRYDAEQAVLSTQSNQQARKEDGGEHGGTAQEKVYDRELQTDVCNTECSDVSESKREPAKEALCASWAAKQLEIVDANEHRGTNHQVHKWVEGYPSPEGNPSSTEENPDRKNEASERVKDPTTGARLLPTFVRKPAPSGPQGYEEKVDAARGTGTHTKDCKGEAVCTPPQRPAGDTEEIRLAQEEITRERGKLSAAPLKPSSGYARSTEDHEAPTQLPESCGTQVAKDGLPRALQETAKRTESENGGTGGTQPVAYAGESDEKQVNATGEAASETEENDSFLQREETLLFLLGCADEGYTKCPTCEAGD